MTTDQTAADAARLTAHEVAYLLAGDASIAFDHATLRALYVKAPGGDDAQTERRFVMQGPSGTHSLRVDATDLDRLNAHWTTFATDPRNRME